MPPNKKQQRMAAATDRQTERQTDRQTRSQSPESKVGSFIQEAQEIEPTQEATKGEHSEEDIQDIT